MKSLDIEVSGFSVYGWITILGIVVGAFLWMRRWKKSPETFGIYVGGLCGAFLGAKLLFVAAEGWIYLSESEGWSGWIQLLAGKTIVGAILGGYAGVEIAKKMISYRKPTGDWFAVAVPLGIAIGRIGCLKYGCCLGELCTTQEWWTIADVDGNPRWPAAIVELIFNLLFVAAILPIAFRGAGRGQLFHVYMIAYGLFRFFHEFSRDTKELPGGFSGYQLGALAMIVLGLVRARQRFVSNVGIASTESRK